TFTLPTICDQAAETVPNPIPDNPQAFHINEDDWRQVEFIMDRDLPQIGATPGDSMIVGFHTDMMAPPPVTHAYTLRNGNFHSFDVPNSMLTQAWDINLRNTIVGDFKDSKGMFHGFLRRGDV